MSNREGPPPREQVRISVLHGAPVLPARICSKSQDRRRNFPKLGPKSQGFPNRIPRYIPMFHKDTKKNNDVHLAEIQVQVWDNIYNIDAVRRKYSITATKSNKSLSMIT